MSENKGKAKVKSTAKTAGTKKKAVLNSRNPKKPMAISGDTMSNYAMYKKGGKVSKIKKYQATNSQVRFQNTDPNAPNYNVAPSITPGSQEMRDKFIDQAQKYRMMQEKKKQEEGTLKGKFKKMFGLYKAGGVTKAKKFAALAPPYNKATAADRIAGAKKNSRKK